jgi:hypothetical protein
MLNSDPGFINERIIEAKRYHWIRSRMKLAFTLIALIFIMLALCSTIGFISHVDLVVKSTPDSFDPVFRSIFLSGGLGVGIFSGCGLVFWILRSRL